MTVEEGKLVEKKNKKIVLVGIRIDGYSRELLNWALVKVANPGDRVLALHVCRNSDSTQTNKPLLDGYLEVYEGLCNVKQVDLTGQVLTGSSVRKVLVREAKNYAAMAVIVGISRKNHLRHWASIAKYCAKRLPPTTEVLAVHNGKVVFRRCSSNQISDLNGDPRPSFYVVRNQTFNDNRSEFGESETSEFTRCSHEGSQCSEYGFRHGGNRDFNKDEKIYPIEEHKRLSLSSISLHKEDLSEQTPGWPLLGTTTQMSPPAREARKLSVVKWVMSLPDRSFPETPQSKNGSSSSESESPLSRAMMSKFIGKSDLNSLFEFNELSENLELLDRIISSNCKWFNHEILRTSTSQFSTDNLIGKGGCNRVYKGFLPDGKPVAVKILKSSKEAWKDFSLEVEIMTSLKHKNITPLLGVSVEDNELVSVYDFLSKGNLEENIHGNNKERSVLSWEVRFNVAIGIAEALNYLHNECSRTVIHRDVKSSNILLTDEFEPQLSDFGLSIWGPKSSSFLTHGDVVGTFGYLAPEYFMYGKVSDKIDVYSFGVVLLELLSGRKPINSETPKGQESLVMWAKPKLEGGDLEAILDPYLDKNVDKVQMQRMTVAATLCLTRSARLRPKMNQILEILKGKKDLAMWLNAESQDTNDTENQENNNDDEVYPESKAESHLGLAMLDVDDNSTSFSSIKKNSSVSLEDYLRGRCSRSSSLD